MPLYESDRKPHTPDPWSAPKPQAAAPSIAAMGDVKPHVSAVGGTKPQAAPATASEGGGAWQGAAKGAAIGAAVGSLLGPLGAGIGGILGGVIGNRTGEKETAHPERFDPTEKIKITDAERKQAETMRGDLSKSLEKLELPQKQRDQILAQCKGLSGDALVEHMRIIGHALQTENADRALSAYADITQMAAADSKHGGRIGTDILGELVTGVADRRTDNDRGMEGILGAKQAREAAEALLKMSDGDFKATTELLQQAGKAPDGKVSATADAGAERSLLLQAVAARKDDFSGADAQKDIATLTSFAKDIRGMERKELIRTTTAIDVDGDNTSTLKPTGMDAAAPVGLLQRMWNTVFPPNPADQRADNDGLFQRYTQSCAPTTAQMTKAAADPIYARALHKSGLNDPGQDNLAAKEQKDILERLGGADGTPDQAVSRLGQKARGDFSTDSKNLLRSGALSDDQFKLLRDYADGKDLSKGNQAALTKALDTMRAANKGHPSESEIQAMRDNSRQTEGDGMYLDDALNDHAKSATHVKYTDHDAQDVSGAVKQTALDTWAEKLRDGQDVPLRVGWTAGGGHFMACTDVRGRGADRKFLISDPWTGTTSWVAEKAIQDGSWTSTFEGEAGSLTHLYYE
jgi:hypothetical protein